MAWRRNVCRRLWDQPRPDKHRLQRFHRSAFVVRTLPASTHRCSLLRSCWSSLRSLGLCGGGLRAHTHTRARVVAAAVLITHRLRVICVATALDVMAHSGGGGEDATTPGEAQQPSSPVEITQQPRVTFDVSCPPSRHIGRSSRTACNRSSSSTGRMAAQPLEARAPGLR